MGDCSQPTFAQNGQKNYYSVHSLCHSVVVGCYSFAPFGGVSMLHPLPPGVARGWHINAPSGRKPYPDTHPRPLPKGGEIEAYPFISDRRTKGQDTPSLREGRGGLSIIPSGGPGWVSPSSSREGWGGLHTLPSGGLGWVSLSCSYRAKA